MNFQAVNIATLVVLLLFCGEPVAKAEDRGPPEVRICSQNLERFGQPSQKGGRKRESQSAKLEALVERIQEARCDIVAIQEIYGERRREAEQNIEKLAQAVSKNFNRPYRFYLGDAPYDTIFNGFLVRSDIAERGQFVSYRDRALPKLQIKGPSRAWSRTPVAFTFSMQGAMGIKTVYLLNFHLKSRSFAWKDPTNTDFEVVRMEQAADIRRIVSQLQFAKPPLVVLLGDRNSTTESASAEILRGARQLTEFFEGGGCSLNESLGSVCAKASAPGDFIELLQRSSTNGARNLDTYQYRDQKMILDELLVNSTTLPWALDSSAAINVGVEGQYRRGSDHRLVWLELNW